MHAVVEQEQEGIAKLFGAYSEPAHSLEISFYVKDAELTGHTSRVLFLA